MLHSLIAFQLHPLPLINRLPTPRLFDGDDTVAQIQGRAVALAGISEKAESSEKSVEEIRMERAG